MDRTRIFVDFWNFQLTWNEHTRNTDRVDWKKLSPWIVSQAEAVIEGKLRFDGTRVYLSYDPRNPKDKSLRNWANNTLDRFTGIDVVMKERKRKGSPTCQACHNNIDKCPICKATLARTVEKGVDTAIVTDLLSFAWDGLWDVAILVSSDRDFIPAVELLSNKGFRVVNAHFPPLGSELARSCWGSLSILPGINHIKR